MCVVRAEALALTAKARPYWESLGYASSLSQRVTLWFLPLSMAGPLLNDHTQYGGSLNAWIAIALAAQGAVMVVFEVARRVIHRRDAQGSRPAATLVAIALAVSARAMVLALLTYEAGFTASIELSYRLFSGFTSALAIICFICFVIRASDVHRDLVVTLDARLASLSALDVSMQGRLAEITRGITVFVASKVDPLVDSLDRALDEVAGGAKVTASVQYLPHAIDDVLRPLSHHLASDRVDLDVLAVPEPAAPIRMVTVPDSIELGSAIFPRICAAMVMLVAVAPAARQLSFLEFIALLVGLGLWVVAGLAGMRWLVGRLRAPAGVCILVITVATGLVLSTGVILMEILNFPVPGYASVLQSSWVPSSVR